MKTARLDPCAVAPGGIEQMMVKLGEPSIVTGVKLDEPEAFEVVSIIAGRVRADAPFTEPPSLPISPPNAFVIVLVKSKTEETRVCGGDLVLEGEGTASASSTLVAGAKAPAPRAVVHAPSTSAAPPVTEQPGTKTFKVDGRGWPLGGMNETWVLMNRGEAERLIQAINGYPITPAERPALLRRFNQALGKVR